MTLENKYLYEELQEFDFQNPPVNPVEFAYELCEELLKLGGVGLAANQIGYNHRCFAIKGDPMIVVYNPRIVYYSDDTTIMDEGCLSFSNLIIPVKRSNTIRVRFQTPNGELLTEKYEGLTSRIFQHEFDHLNGITFKKRATKFHLDRARKNLKIRKRRQK